MNAMDLMKKVPWRKVLKVVGVAAIGTSSVMGAMEADEKTKGVIIKLAGKATTLFTKGES